MVKGYQHFAGRALDALKVIEECTPLLKEYKVIVYSAHTQDVQKKANEINKNMNILVELLPYTQDHSKMLELFSQARIYLGVSSGCY